MQRERAIILAGLSTLTILCWGYLIHEVMASEGLPECCLLAATKLWTIGTLINLLLMWSIMMVGMMVPTAAPMVLMFAGINRQRRAQGRRYVSTGLFLSGYLLVWIGFSIVATVVQWALHRSAMMSPGMVSTNKIFGGSVLIAAGIFQFTSAKTRCLAHCRSPIDFIMTQWREGRAGAFRMGTNHGLSCTGCCWLLMAVLFVVGVMNLIGMAAITAFVLMEKTLPGARVQSIISGTLLILWGMVVLMRG